MGGSEGSHRRGRRQWTLAFCEEACEARAAGARPDLLAEGRSFCPKVARQPYDALRSICLSHQCAKSRASHAASPGLPESPYGEDQAENTLFPERRRNGERGGRFRVSARGGAV